MATRPDPEPCREQDLGLFEITQRDGAARIGKLHTKHGMVTTPMLLPVDQSESANYRTKGDVGQVWRGGSDYQLLRNMEA